MHHDDLPKARRAPRRAVELTCQLVSHYSDEAAAYVATDLSPYGIWLKTPMPFHMGAEVVVSFSPPSWQGGEFTVFGQVARVTTGRRRRDRGALGMGVEFTDLTMEQATLMRSCLRGLPPARH